MTATGFEPKIDITQIEPGVFGLTVHDADGERLLLLGPGQSTTISLAVAVPLPARPQPPQRQPRAAWIDVVVVAVAFGWPIAWLTLLLARHSLADAWLTAISIGLILACAAPSVWRVHQAATV